MTNSDIHKRKKEKKTDLRQLVTDASQSFALLTSSVDKQEKLVKGFPNDMGRYHSLCAEIEK